MVVRKVIAGLLTGIWACTLLSVTPPASAQTKLSAAQTYALDIPQLPIIDALKEFTAQTGLLVSFWPDAHTDQTMTVGPLRGKFTAEAALIKLLASSGLDVRRTNERSLVVMAPSLSQSPHQGVAASAEDHSDEANGQANLRPQNHPPPVTEVVAGNAGSNTEDHRSSTDPLDEVIVTGSRIERSGEGPAPVQVFTRERFEQLGAASIPDVLRYTPQQPFARAQYYYQNGAEYAQMRGIGVDTTLVLINGRRVVPTSNSLTLNAFDLNTIPLAAVERIEVLSDSASAIYGADAMGGVINIVLKKEIPQPVIDVQYGGADGGAGTRQVSLSAGYSTGRSRTSLILDYYERDFLFGAERDRWNDQDFRRYGGTDYRSPAGMPGTVRSSTGTNLPGLSSSFAAIPDGSTGVGLTPSDFQTTAGVRNRTSTLSSLSIVPQVDQRSAAVFSEYDFESGLTSFTQVLYTRRTSVSQDERYSVLNATVPASHPNNPFGQAVFVDFLLEGMPQRQFIHELELARGVTGLRGSLGSTWEWEVAATASTETDDASATNQISSASINAALADKDPSRLLNPFVDGPAGSPELLASLVTPNEQHHFSRGRQLSAFARGELFDLPAGTVNAVIGGEWRDEDMVFDDFKQAVNDGRHVRAAFTELNVPLISDPMYRPANVLSLTLAARLDEYSDFGSTVNPQLGLMWRPMPDLLLRGSYGTSFRPPSLYELHAPVINYATVAVADPARNNARSNVMLLIGGNPDLRPIEADSMTTGFVLTPSAVPGLRLLANYWKIHTDHRVTILPYLTLLANETSFAGRVIRDAQTPADIAAGVPGRLMTLDISRMNFGRLQTSGVDIEGSYDWGTPIGIFTPRLSATWVDDFTSIDIPGAEPTERVGVAHAMGSVPRWRLVSSLAWKQGGLGLSTTVDWRSGYMDANATGITGRKLPSRALVDLQASWALDETLGESWLWDDLKLQAGVKNVFDEQPPFANIGFAIGFDSSQGDLVGRFGYIKLSKGF